jgi:peptidyl-prolyl cis-trans isomerase B (cyclophilin B)
MNKIARMAGLMILLLPACFLMAQTKQKQVKTKQVSAPTSNAIAVVTPAKTTSPIKIKISTNLGDIIVVLSDKTPKHRDNFVKLVNEHFYDSLLFHRVINSFMIQGGDPNSKHATPGAFLGNGDVGYTIPAEFDSTLYHKRGALAAARNDNPAKASSGCQFYIVQGKKRSDSELDLIETNSGVYFSPAKRMTYKMNGGTPKLDMNYTVFGEVETGMEVVDAILMEQVDGNNRPLRDISMKMEVVKEEIK